MKNIKSSKAKIFLGTTALLSSVLLMQHISADQINGKEEASAIVGIPSRLIELNSEESISSSQKTPSQETTSSTNSANFSDKASTTKADGTLSSTTNSDKANTTKVDGTPSSTTSPDKTSTKKADGAPSSTTSSNKTSTKKVDRAPSSTTSSNKASTAKSDGATNSTTSSNKASTTKVDEAPSSTTGSDKASTTKATRDSIEPRNNLQNPNGSHWKEVSTTSETSDIFTSNDEVSSIKMINTSSNSDFIKSIAPRIRILAGKNNLFASIIIAQAILESNYGKSYLSQKAFNLFNLTGEYDGSSYSMNTIEYNGKYSYNAIQSFRVYPTFDSSVLDYLKLMLHGTTWNSEIYSRSWKSNAKTYQNAAKALQGTYATDPNYANLLIEIIQEYHLDDYDNVSENKQFTSSSSSKANGSFPEYNGVEYPGSDSYAFGNCTQYVYNRIFQLGGKIGQYMGNGGEWGQNAKLQGYTTTSIPTEGFAVSFPPGVAGSSTAYGHVAFVEKVYNDGSILVSEMNVIGNNVVSTRHISSEITKIATFIQPK